MHTHIRTHLRSPPYHISITITAPCPTTRFLSNIFRYDMHYCITITTTIIIIIHNKIMIFPRGCHWASVKPELYLHLLPQHHQISKSLPSISVHMVLSYDQIPYLRGFLTQLALTHTTHARTDIKLN